MFKAILKVATEVEVEKRRKEEKLKRKVAMPSLTAAEREVHGAVDSECMCVCDFCIRQCGWKRCALGERIC